jgi:hypothetical protein
VKGVGNHPVSGTVTKPRYPSYESQQILCRSPEITCHVYTRSSYECIEFPLTKRHPQSSSRTPSRVVRVSASGFSSKMVILIKQSAILRVVQRESAVSEEHLHLQDRSVSQVWNQPKRAPSRSISKWKILRDIGHSRREEAATDSMEEWTLSVRGLSALWEPMKEWVRRLGWSSLRTSGSDNRVYVTDIDDFHWFALSSVRTYIRPDFLRSARSTWGLLLLVSCFTHSWTVLFIVTAVRASI